MTIALAIVIILVLCFILRISVNTILMVSFAIAAFVFAAMAIFFLAFTVLLLFTKRKEARFVKIDRIGESRFTYAFYLVDNREYPCVFIEEGVMRERLYRKDRPLYVRLNERMGRVYDVFSIVTCLIGLPFSAISCAVFLYLLTGF